MLYPRSYAEGHQKSRSGNGPMKNPLKKRSNVAEKQALTPDALAALRSAGFSRRSFLKSTGALIVTFSVAGIYETADAQENFAGGVAGSPPSEQVDSWIAIGADGNVTAYTGKCELGQGIVTAQTQLVAEELCVPFSRVKLFYCDTSMTPDQGVTSAANPTPRISTKAIWHRRGLRRARRCSSSRPSSSAFLSKSLQPKMAWSVRRATHPKKWDTDN